YEISECLVGSEMCIRDRAIAEAQTAIYPQASPGGWHLLGRSPWRPFDPAATPPCPLALGDRVRFVAIGREAFLDLGGRE
ncbi:carboxyltransferase domain-containing protein, partial [Pseudomonas aeruginosa]|nr:carboxyltransferase domain-containing protein [Pseudomonas aeruginosa]